MASKKEIKEYVRIKLEKIKKKEVKYPSPESYIGKFEDAFLGAVFLRCIERVYGDHTHTVNWLLYDINGNLKDVAPRVMIEVVDELNKDITDTYYKNKAMVKYNNDIDEKYKNFCTEMLLVGNGQLADFAKAFIESLNEVE